MRGPLLLVLLATCGPTTRAGSPTMQYDKAIAQLDSAETWCAGAERLAALGERDAVVPILRAYESRTEGDKLCLLDALDALGAREQAHALFDAGDADQRRLAAHLMELLPDEAHLPWLERGAVDDEEPVRRQALRALATQRQSPAWEAAMIRLLSSESVDARRQAIDSLSRRRSETARAALEARAAVETDPDLKQRLGAP